MSKPGLVDCFFRISAKRVEEKDSQSSFEEGFEDLSLDSGSSEIERDGTRERRVRMIRKGRALEEVWVACLA